MILRNPRAIAPIVLGLVGVVALCLLCAWQVQRLEWKQGLINEITARASAEPVAVPAMPDPEVDNLRRVRATGMLGTSELHAIHAIKRRGPGYRLVVPFTLADGRRIMADLGFIAEAAKDRVPRQGSVRWTEGRAEDEIVGQLHWPRETDSFTPAPDLGRNIWFARDVESMAAALDTEPVLIVAVSHPDQELTTPQPPGIDIPNRHLEYALTWFGLAVVWAAMSIAWLRTRTRRREGA